MNNQEHLDSIIDFIQKATYDKLSNDVKKQARKCFLDLAGVTCAGAKNNSSKCAAKYVLDNFKTGECTILATGERTNLIGAAMSNGMAANALDMDDGYSLLRGHPGSGFFGALISAAEESKCTYGEFLAALVVAYEISIRDGFSVRDYYNWDHSSGCYSAFGTAASVGKLMNLNSHELEMALGIAEFDAPLNPAKRSCYVPSMNKDGIYYGQYVGTQAVVMAMHGITGKNPVLFDENYFEYIDSLGKKYYMFDLYIKYYSCCRWAHGPICAVADLVKTNDISIENIKKIDVFSFGFAGTLYKEAPQTEDEAQYNIKYPIAAQVVFGDCGPLESSTTKMLDARIKPMIDKIDFHHEPEFDNVFPAKRLSRVEITLNSGKVLKSKVFEPRGEKNADVTIENLKEKIYKINGLYAQEKDITAMIEAVLNTSPEAPFENIFTAIKKLSVTNIHPELEFI